MSRLGPWYGWGASSPNLSWLLCPLISLGFLDVEARRAIPAYSTGPRAPLPDSQAQFWTSRARDVIHAFADHFSSLASENPLAVALSSQVSGDPAGDHLEACIQEALTPPTSHQCGKCGSLRRLVVCMSCRTKSKNHLHPLTRPAAQRPLRPRPISVPRFPQGAAWPLLGLRSLHNIVLPSPPWCCCLKPFVTTTAPVEARGPVRNSPSPLPRVCPVLRHSELPHCSRRLQPHWRSERPFGRPNCMGCMATN